jgi:deoxyribodipyrimidine photo-lyase
MTEPIAFCWLRRDLRLSDNAALYHALRSGRPVLPVFIFDRNILDALDDRRDRRVEFIHQEISRLHHELAKLGSTIIVRYGQPEAVWRDLTNEYQIEAVYANHDYETYAKNRDTTIANLLAEGGAGFHTFKDQSIFERDEVLTGAGKPYTVFTPYSRNWKSKLNEFYLKSYPTETYFGNFYKTDPQPVIPLADMNFQPLGEPFPGRTVATSVLETYDKTRDFPALDAGTSQLSIHLRFGTVSVRELARQAQDHNREAGPQTYLNELCWRDFYFQVLDHFPHVEKHSFRREYDNIEWRNNESEFARWCDGQTGYPMVDAGMRQLNTLGWMHNRVRMVTASFLCKHLLIDWRWGEAYFGKKLRDYDLSANNGGWQWAAGSGTDAAPYFRVFNPELQAQKFDPKGDYIRLWVPELQGFGYPRPVVDHAMARQRAIDVYKEGLQ